MRVREVRAVAGLGGYYFDDLAAIQAGAAMDGFFYLGEPMTQGHRAVRQPGETVSVLLILEDGLVAQGDGAAIQYSGVVGRDPIFLADTYLPQVRGIIAPLVVGEDVSRFRPLAERVEAELARRHVHTGLRYAISQALLHAASLCGRRTMAESVADEYGLSPSWRAPAVFPQSGDDRFTNADKMILKQADVLPQGLFNTMSKVGADGSTLLEYTRWLSERIQRFGAPGYAPVVHLDVYGTVSLISGNDIEASAAYLNRLAQAALPWRLRVEAPLYPRPGRPLEEDMHRLKEALSTYEVRPEIVADDYCNTLSDVKTWIAAGAADMIQIKTPDLGGITNSIEAVLACKVGGVGVFLGGTCNETDHSARVTVHLAIATDSDQIYAKPGMGVDEGMMICRNEIARALALVDKVRRR